MDFYAKIEGMSRSDVKSKIKILSEKKIHAYVNYYCI